jgi:DNA mismatch repair endonuclease MutH
MEGFDYKTSTEEQILARAALLEGMRLGDIPGAMFASTDPGRGRQEVGHAVEAWFGIAPNPMQAPDFPGAAIELKTVPLVLGTRGLRVKERTVVSLIDFVTLARETWETASVRKKLRILFVFFEHLRGRPKNDYPIHSVVLWKPSEEIEEQIRRDWEAVHGKVLAGLAHELSEADGRILGPCTKGADSSVLRAQPFSDQFAKSRAFALKPSFTFALYVEPATAPLAPEKIAESASQDELQRRFRRFIGRTVGEVARELGMEASVAKNYAARIVMKAVLDASPLPASEFKLVGPTVRVPRIGRDKLPYEALSFPAFVHMELVEETWEDSALLADLEHMLIAPTLGTTKATLPDACVLQEPVYWRPTADQLELIEAEWTTFRDLIAAGEAGSLPTESQTRAIHVRPHARDATDQDPAPGGGSQMKKSFWLNKRFVQQILMED